MKTLIIIALIIIANVNSVIAHNFTVQNLKEHLKRNICITGFTDLEPTSGNHPYADAAEYQCWLNFISENRPKYVGMSGIWGNDFWWYNWAGSNVDFFQQCQKTVSAVHAIDPDIICESAINEVLTMNINSWQIKIPIPTFVKNDLNLWNLGTYFDASQMVDPATVVNNEGFIDITRPMTQAWCYYFGCKFIDAGFEALRIGQIERVAQYDAPNYNATYEICTKLREYAASRNRGFVLIESHTTGLHWNGTSQLIFDLHSGPIGTLEREAVSRGDGMNGNYDYEATINDPAGCLNKGLLYGNSAGGISPLDGQYVGHNPFFLEFDNSGGYASWVANNNPPNLTNICWYPWGWDETTWFTQQSELYRNHWLLYAWHKVRCLDQDGYLAFLGRKPYVTGAGADHQMYRAYGNSDCGTGFNQEETIKNIWDAHDNSLPQNLKYYNRWTSGFEPQYNTTLPEGKRYFGDFNGDGNIDILETADKGKGQWWTGYNVYYSNGSTFQLQFSNAWPGWGEHYYIGDYNGDGMDDFIITADGVVNPNGVWTGYQMYLSTGNGFNQATTASWPSWGERLYPGDFNGDGMDDFLATTANGHEVYSSSGSSFSLTISGSWPSWGERFFIGDYNGDGKDDFLVTADKVNNPNFVWGGYKLYHSTGSAFVLKNQNYWPSWGENFVIGDWNDDGYDDFTVKASNTFGVNWVGLRTYMGNESGDHFIFSFDNPNVIPDIDILCHRKSSNDNLMVIVDNLGGADLYEYNPVYCVGGPTDGRKESNANNQGNTTGLGALAGGVDPEGKILNESHVYPNPTKGIFNVRNIKGSLLQITDVSGKTIYSKSIDGDDAIIDLSTAAKGLYILSIADNNGLVKREKLILE